jgi:hypothetical protein
MAATPILGAELLEAEIQTGAPGAGDAPLTDWQRKRILIAAAAAAAVGGPVRILDIRPAGDAQNAWVKRSRVRVRAARHARSATPRRPGVALPPPEEEPSEGGQAQ